MRLIDTIGDEPDQQITFNLGGGNFFMMVLKYNTRARGWFIDELIYNSMIAVKGIKVVESDNLLLPFKNTLGFGLACVCKGNFNPTFLSDFSDGRCELRVLDASEI